MELKELESAIEAILFAAGDPVPAERICTALEQDRETVDAVCQRLADDYSYERRGDPAHSAGGQLADVLRAGARFGHS